jgi:hypothetical protein
MMIERFIGTKHKERPFVAQVALVFFIDERGAHELQ